MNTKKVIALLEPALGDSLTVGSNEILELLKKAEKYQEKCLGNLTEIYLWSILTALRSCDKEDDELKKLTTERIRGIVCPCLSEEGCANFRASPLSTDEIAKRNIMLNMSSCPSHFRNHYWRAVRAIRALYGVDLGTEEVK